MAAAFAIWGHFGGMRGRKVSFSGRDARCCGRTGLIFRRIEPFLRRSGDPRFAEGREIFGISALVSAQIPKMPKDLKKTMT